MRGCILALVALVDVISCNVVINLESYLTLPNRNNNTVIDSGTATESAYDEIRHFLYVVGRETSMLHVINLGNPSAPQYIRDFKFNPLVEGRPLDVEVCRTTGRTILAVSFDGVDSIAFEGHVELFYLLESVTDDLVHTNPTDPKVTVGAHPDNIKFTSDCLRLIVSNEGEPRTVEGRFVDPIGTINILTWVDIEQRPTTSTLDFLKYDDPDELSTLLAQGVRYWLRRNPSNTSQIIQFSQCVEPEYVAVSPSNGFAYVTLQENNAIAHVDLLTNQITDIYPMGNKSWSSLSLDASDRDSGPEMVHGRRIYGLYMPDKVAFVDWDGKMYLVTTDEGKPTDLPGIAFSDFARANSISWSVQDSELESQLGTNSQLGRLMVSTVDGFTSIPHTPYTFGGRGFSIWNTDPFEREYESGDELEQYSRDYYLDTFNGDASSFSQTPPQQSDQRSTWMGIELSALAVGDFDGRKVLVFGSGRNGLLYVYIITPNLSRPVGSFQSVHRAGEIDGTWQVLYGRGDMGDAVITDMRFIDGPQGPLLVVISKASTSVSVYSFADEPWPPTKDAVEE